jgi:predicted amidophosphoribosyltransferase
MEGVAAALVHGLKYGGWDSLGLEMGAQMAEASFSRSVEAELSLVVPVPARGVARRRGLPLLSDVLNRRRHTQRQTHLAPRERLTNVAGSFGVPVEGRVDIEGRHLLLVDDVLTTAATAQDCVRALCSSGARAVSVVTFARARRELRYS